VTLAVNTTYRIEHWTGAAVAATGFGRPTTTGLSEIYTEVRVLKYK